MVSRIRYWKISFVTVSRITEKNMMKKSPSNLLYIILCCRKIIPVYMPSLNIFRMGSVRKSESISQYLRYIAVFHFLIHFSSGCTSQIHQKKWERIESFQAAFWDYRMFLTGWYWIASKYCQRNRKSRSVNQLHRTRIEFGEFPVEFHACCTLFQKFNSIFADLTAASLAIPSVALCSVVFGQILTNEIREMLRIWVVEILGLKICSYKTKRNVYECSVNHCEIEKWFSASRGSAIF